MILQQIKDRADRVRGIPLEAVLLLTGAQRDRYDQAKWHTHRGSLSVTGQKFMNWKQAVGGGGAIDLVIHLHNLSFKAAVQWLWFHFPKPPPQQQTRPHPAPNLELPPEDPRRLSRVTQYLVHQRNLPLSLVQPLINSGRLYADNRGNAVFLLLGKHNQPVGAELQGTTLRPFKGMAPGSCKDRGYFSIPAPGAITIVLCESAIDVISCQVIHPQFLCLSTSGARSNPHWLIHLIQRGYHVFCGFDADPTGDNMAQAMIALHPSIKRLRPQRKDWNDILKSLS